MNFTWIFLAIIFRVLAGICAKMAGIYSTGGPLSDIVLNMWYLLEIIFLFLQAVFWILVLRNFELSFAYPFMSLAIILNIIAANLIFYEEVFLNHYFGILIIAIGVFILNKSKIDSIQ